MEIEINFRFDDNGRTANTKINEGNISNNNTDIAQNEIDYGFRAQMTDLKTSFESSSKEYESSPSTTKNEATSALPSTLPSMSPSTSMMDDILLDCEISDNLIMPRTYWMPADGRARCALEQFALDVFRHHVPNEGFEYDHSTSGAEWWCQLRPSPDMGRHTAILQPQDKDDTAIDPFTNGISFHVDKDEELRILTGGSTSVHPHLSTITYLTDFGSPTLIVDCQVHPLTGEWIVPEHTVEGFVSWPSVGKHTSFDGRYLHASPPDLMGDKDAFQKQLESAKAKLLLLEDGGDNVNGNVNGNDSNGTLSKVQKRRCRRVTFLVNVWLNYKPYDVNPFPESMLDKMSGKDETLRKGLTFGSSRISSSTAAAAAAQALHVQNTRIRSDRATEVGTAPPTSDDTESKPESASSDATTYRAQKFTWPLGDKRSGETLECRMPLRSIRESSNTGGNVRIQWQTTKKPTDGNDDAKNENKTENSKGCVDCFRLLDGKSSGPAEASPTAVVETKEICHEGEELLSSHTDPTIFSSDAKSSKRPRID